MFNFNKQKVLTAWNRTPKKCTTLVNKDLNNPLIPGPMRIQIERSGVKFEIFETEEQVPISALLIWSPKNGGTLHIDLGMLRKLRFLDRMVLLKLSLEIHKHYKCGRLTLTETDVVWNGKSFTGSWVECMKLYNDGLRKAGMEMLGNLPWLATGRPSQASTDVQDCHLHVLETITKAGIGEVHA